MSSTNLRCLLLIVIFICIIHCSSSIWRNARQPKIMGDRIPVRALMPHRKRIQKKIVLYHNYFRTKVIPRAANMLRMKWHKGCAKAAQRWANQCMLLTHDNVTGRYINNYGSCGQNIFVSSHQVPWLFAIKTWWLEKDNFTFGSPNNDLLVVGHYTQMVWAATHEVGCGLTKCNRIGDLQVKPYFNYVCNYCPIGNSPVKLGRPYRRGRPCGMCKRSCHVKKLCTNSCPVADYWVNCKELYSVWPSWLCSTHTPKGEERLTSCKATCLCKGRVHD